MPAPEKGVDLSVGRQPKEFDLGEGEKEVLLYCPWSAQVIFSEVTVSDGAFVEPVKPEKKMLVFGDSITQGYDAAYACNSYISRLARTTAMSEAESPAAKFR